MNKNIIVTGGAGFIGGHLVDYLISKDYNVTVIDNFSGGNYKNPKAYYINTGIEDVDSKVFYFVDTVYHLSGVLDVEASKKDPTKYLNENSTFTYRLLDMCVKAEVRKFIYASSCASAFPASSPYALSKYLPEIYCDTYHKVFGIQTASLRFFNVYGDRMNHSGYKLVLSIFIDQYKNKQPLTVTNNGEQRRDFIHVNDIVSALFNVKDVHTNAEVFDVGSGTTHSILDIVAMFESDYEYIGERLEDEIATANIDKTKKVLNWKPIHKLKDFIECVKK